MKRIRLLAPAALLAAAAACSQPTAPEPSQADPTIPIPNAAPSFSDLLTPPKP